jgi:threonine aldolase
MRQAGVIAAAGVHALEHHVERLAEDHAKARKLAEGLAAVKGIEVDVAAAETNIVVFDIAASGVDRATFLKRVAERGVRFSPLMKPAQLRAVTHLDIPADGVEKALAAVRLAVG